ncbi:hypothetical protein J0X14_14400 [Muricauda sp. CAU 1633]|uniref:hypothetical protein n=1 Tax=Allomuricauda sp. CAU 1633 TaxID=2816036 RepID=UPI001A90BAFB|nr:hypothetical protein [Muricauda sp. CAU 1633]MBO0323496.1 hypothetical protein [Muricauda sp. CAU 1633]
MKPILKNFSGSGRFEYRIHPTIGKNFVSLDMYIKTPFTEDFVFLNGVSGDFKEGQKSSIGLEKALKLTEDKWGLNLIKADLQAV